MLLVDDDEPRRRQRCEHGRSRADDEPRLAAVGAPPRVEPLPLGDGRVQHGELLAEAFAQAAHELRRQADLGHEQQRLPAGRELRRDEPQVDLGLAAARDAVQQIRAESLARRLRRRDRREHAALIGGELGLAPRRARARAQPAGARVGAAGSIQPLAASRSSVPAATSCALSSLAVKRARAQRRERARLLPRACAAAARDPARGRAPSAATRARAARRSRGLRAATLATRGSARRRRDGGSTRRPTAARARSSAPIAGARVEHAADRLQPRRRHVGRGRMVDDEADPLAAAERYAHATAECRQSAGRCEIVERVGERHRYRDPDQLSAVAHGGAIM